MNDTPDPTPADLAASIPDPAVPDDLLEEILTRQSNPGRREKSARVARGIVTGARKDWIAVTAATAASLAWAARFLRRRRR